jgi:hypothetical protein
MTTIYNDTRISRSRELEHLDGIDQDAVPGTLDADSPEYRVYVRRTIEVGIKESDEGRTLDVKAVRKRFGLTG